MSPEVGLAATRIALFLIVAAGLMLFVVAPNSAEFVVSVLTIGIGLAMLGIVALLARIGGVIVHRSSRTEEDQEMDDGPTR